MHDGAAAPARRGTEETRNRSTAQIFCKRLLVLINHSPHGGRKHDLGPERDGRKKNHDCGVIFTSPRQRRVNMFV